VRILLPALALAAAWGLLFLGLEPVPKWFYVFAWYPTLFLLDGIVVSRGGSSLLARRGLALSLFGWSVVVWLVFEAVNFRIENWYYVFLPRSPVERWVGITVSFATVVPAIVLLERMLARLGVGERWTGRPLRRGLRHTDQFIWIGLAALLLTLAKPNWFFPLVWGAVVLIADPLVYRRQPDLSLIADVERGDWRRIGRLMIGGLIAGGLWETYNHWAQGKWIYTVPLLEDLKWFEMPPLGFAGFPFFALEAWAMYSALVVMGVALPIPTGDGGRSPAMAGDERGRSETGGDDRRRARTIKGDRGRRRRRAVAAGVAGLLGVATLLGMERYTISSTVPAMGTLPPEFDGVQSVWTLAAAEPDSLAAVTALPPDSVRRIIELARLATLRGMGSGHARALARAGLRNVCDLAAADAHNLWAHLHALNPELGRRPTEAEVRVWIPAAVRACTS
jgi:hypothetical protein